MNGKRILRMLSLNVGYYLWVIFLLALVTFLYDYRVAAFEMLILAALSVYYFKTNRRRKTQIAEYVNSLTLNVDTATANTLVNFPLPVVALQLNGIIAWYNDQFSNMLGGQEVFEASINEFVPELDLDNFHKDDSRVSCDIEHNGRYYHVFGNIAKIGESTSEYLLVLYWDDRTSYEIIKEKYYKEKFVSAIVVIDNYEDLMQDTPAADKPKLIATIEETLERWVQDTNGILKKYEKDRFFFYFEKRYLDEFTAKNFEVLDAVREINVGNKIPATLSIGIGYGGETMAENDKFSYSALDMALGRGGDQAIVKDNEQYYFYGGRSKELEKRTRVKARVVAYAIRELICSANDIIIMGHRNADIDVLGAALGLYRAVENAGKHAKILLETYNHTVRRMLNQLDETYDEVFITRAFARELVTENTLVFVLDTHKHTLVEEPELLNIAKRIVLVDHHRRSTDFIENAVIIYHEPYASSTSELITEVIQYMDDTVNLQSAEAEALYAGIFMDTKNFTFKTGVRTFEAASYLRRVGVDTVAVKKLFQVDLSTMVEKLSIIEQAQIYRGNIAISSCRQQSDDMQTVVAQAADELLNITDITSSFVICEMDDFVIISGRSLGDINVQVILEKLGGGGHMTIAGAQLKDTTAEQALLDLKAAIDDYLETK